MLNLTDRQLHHISLKLAKQFASTYKVDKEAAEDSLTAFRAIRRLMKPCKTGKTYGSKTAYMVCQGKTMEQEVAV